VLKRGGFVAQEFSYDLEQFEKNEKLKSALDLQLSNINKKVMNMCYYNF
jgi:hypothetical protein